MTINSLIDRTTPYSEEELKERILLECVHVDTCLPDYWGGRHLPHIAVTVWNGMTLRELKASLEREVREGSFMGACEDVRLLTADLIRNCEVPRANRLTKAAYSAVRRITTTKRGRLFKNLEERGDEDESPLAWFVFVKIDSL